MFFISSPNGQTALPAEELLLIGRGEQCDIVVNDPSVSRAHCRMLSKKGRVFLYDAGSRWGTGVNGERVEKCELKVGDKISVGDVILTLEVEQTPHATTLVRPKRLKPRTPKRGNTAADVSPGAQDEFDRNDAVAHAANMQAIQDKAAELLEQLKQHRTPREAKPPAGGDVDVHPRAGLMPVAFNPQRFIPSEFIGKQFERYRIEELIAQSRSGMVFKADDPMLKQHVALKVFRPDFLNSDEERSRFLRAIRTMLNLRHENLVTLYNAGEVDGMCYTITDYIEGDSVENMINRIGVAGMLDWRTTLKIGLDIAKALECLSEHKIVHRNLIPSNILVRKSDNTALLSDVTLAKAFDGTNYEQLTQQGSVVGQFEYLPPEQLGSGDPIDARADMYQLGVSLYSLLAGRLPFTSNSPATLIQQILTQSPNAPSRYHLGIPDLFEGLVLRLLSKRPQQRFVNSTELRKEIERVAKLNGLHSPVP